MVCPVIILVSYSARGKAYRRDTGGDGEIPNTRRSRYLPFDAGLSAIAAYLKRRPTCTHEHHSPTHSPFLDALSVLHGSTRAGQQLPTTISNYRHHLRATAVFALVTCILLLSSPTSHYSWGLFPRPLPPQSLKRHALNPMRPSCCLAGGSSCHLSQGARTGLPGSGLSLAGISAADGRSCRQFI